MDQVWIDEDLILTWLVESLTYTYASTKFINVLFYQILYIFLIIQKGITLLLINLSSNTTVQVHVSMENAPGNRTSPQEHRKEMTKLSSIHGNFESNGDHTREEYHLTAKDGNLHSQTMLLNGKTLSVKSSGNIPLLEPVYVTSSAPISVAPFSILFAHIPTINLPACN